MKVIRKLEEKGKYYLMVLDEHGRECTLLVTKEEYQVNSEGSKIRLAFTGGGLIE